jgi:hypothetical protein
VVTIAVTTVVDAAAELLDRHVAFHLAVGADVVLVTGAPEASLVAAWEAGGRVRRVDGASHTELARIAVSEYGADWVIPSAADEFWWPRGESLTDVLAVIPPRYSVVQALVRTFIGAGLPEERTTRTSLTGPRGADDAPLARLLRPAYRAELEMVIDDEDWTLRGRRVPLRAWYPLEVFRFPADPAIGLGDVDTLLADGTLVTDTRLSDVLRGLGTTPSASEVVALPVPSIVDDAAYAVECAAVGEVDLVGLDRQIRELELRIAALEATFWPSVRRRLRRLARRPG